MKNKLTSGFLSGNQLKLIALLTMTSDHIGKEIFPQFILLRIIGRLAFPIFAYMIAEGCRYTKNRRKYLATMIGFSVICQIFYFFVLHSLYQCILVTFSLSIALIYALDNLKKKRDSKSILYVTGMILFIYFLTQILPGLLRNTNFNIDYGLWGVMLPVFVFIGEKKAHKLVLAGISLLLLSYSIGYIQWYSLFSLILLAFYSGKRGKMKLKNLFYIYYPLHLVIIYLIGNFI